ERVFLRSDDSSNASSSFEYRTHGVTEYGQVIETDSLADTGRNDESVFACDRVDGGVNKRNTDSRIAWRYSAILFHPGSGLEGGSYRLRGRHGRQRLLDEKRHWTRWRAAPGSR